MIHLTMTLAMLFPFQLLDMAIHIDIHLVTYILSDDHYNILEIVSLSIIILDMYIFSLTLAPKGAHKKSNS